MDIPLIIDFGSATTKSGYHQIGRNVPKYVTPSVVGKPRRRFVHFYPPECSYVGDEVMQHKHHLSLTYPIDHGHIDEWLQFEELFAHVVLMNKQELRPDEPLPSIINSALEIEPYFKDTPLLITVPAASSAKRLENIAEIAFEMFNFPELLFASSGALSLFGQGSDTGLSVEIGHGITQIVPTISGFCDRSAVKRAEYGGLEVSMLLQKMLCDDGQLLTTRTEFGYVQDVKEKSLFIVQDPRKSTNRKEKNNDVTYRYVLPDGEILRSGERSINVTREMQSLAPEVMFEPSFMNRDDSGLTDLIWAALKDSSVDSRRELLRNITLGGGGSLLDGLQKRLELEMMLTCPNSVASEAKVIARDGREFSAWAGGNIVANPSFRKSQDQSWVTKQMYREGGAKVLMERQM